MFEVGTILFSVVPILILVLFVIALVVFIKKGRHRGRHQLDDISRKLDKLVEQSRNDGSRS